MYRYTDMLTFRMKAFTVQKKSTTNNTIHTE